MKKSKIPMAKLEMSVGPDTESEYFEFSMSRSFSTSGYNSNKTTSNKQISSRSSNNAQISVIPYTKPEGPVQIIYIKDGNQYIHDPDRCACDKCQLGRQCKIMWRTLEISLKNDVERQFKKAYLTKISQKTSQKSIHSTCSQK